MRKKHGRQTVCFEQPPIIIGAYSIGGVKESEGPLKDDFDTILDDDKWGEDSWEKAETKLQREAVKGAMANAGLEDNNIDYIFAGDLQNQCAGTHYAIRDMAIPFFGIYGACSTMSESMSLGAMMIDGGFADNVLCVTSSHFCSAEKQFRFPLEYGGQRTPTAQWTVTGAGSVTLSSKGNGPRITAVTTGKIVDYGITDINNMGAAMAPAAADTLLNYFEASGSSPEDYDLIVSGDLGHEGVSILSDLLAVSGVDASGKLSDCGVLIYDAEAQDVHAGGSGCGCSAVVLASYLLPKLKRGELSNILIYGTGAMMSPASLKQGLAIPAVAHLLHLTSPVFGGKNNNE